jgi:hypothetical protein
VSLTLLEHLSSPPVFCEVRFTRSLVLCACFVDCCPFVLFHCVVCSFSIDEFWLPIWYLQTLLTNYDWQFERCGIFCFSFYNCSNGVVYFVFHLMTVRTVWYISFFLLRKFEQCGIFCFSYYDCSNGVVYFVFHLMTVRTVWYILFFILWQFEQCGIFSFSFYNCSNGVVYFVFHLMTVRTVWYILFFIL